MTVMLWALSDFENSLRVEAESNCGLIATERNDFDDANIGSRICWSNLSAGSHVNERVTDCKLADLKANGSHVSSLSCVAARSFRCRKRLTACQVF